MLDKENGFFFRKKSVSIVKAGTILKTGICLGFYDLPAAGTISRKPRLFRETRTSSQPIVYLDHNYDVSLVHQCRQLRIYMCLSIYGIYIAPLQGNYSEALPAQAWFTKAIVFSWLIFSRFNCSCIFFT